MEKKSRKRKTNNSLIREIKAKSDNQQKYLNAIYDNEIVFCIGPAGTGKTMLSCSCAAKFLAEGKIDKIILCRPAVEAGEKLGYLPGTLEDKINPYLRPIYDALEYFMGRAAVNDFIEQGSIEIVPLAFMRGRTLSNAFVILDEAQNTNVKQMHMFLTRMGENSHFVINGDITQTDLETQSSGLKDAWDRLGNIHGIKLIELERQDIIRHPLVQKIVDRYEE